MNKHIWSVVINPKEKKPVDNVQDNNPKLVENVVPSKPPKPKGRPRKGTR